MTGHYSYVTGQRAALLARTRMPAHLRDRLEGKRVYAPIVAKDHRVTVNCKTGERTVETVDHIERMRPRPKAVEGPKTAPTPPPPKPKYVSIDSEEAAYIKAETAKLVAHMSDMKMPWCARLTVTTITEVARVMAVFVQEFNAVRCDGGDPRTIADLTRSNRARPHSWARSVCIALCARLVEVSFNNLGNLFGGRDHTSILYSVRMAPEYMAKTPVLADVHARVLARFESAK